MEESRQEALKCLAIAEKYLENSDFESAIRFTQKSIRLHATPRAKELLVKIDKASVSYSSGSKSSSADHSQSGQQHPHSHQQSHKAAAPEKSSHTSAASNTGKEYTPEQLAAVKAFKKKDKNDYYAVLDLSKDASEADIKKAYKKLALQFHPDKNNAPGADEAFKAVSRAFALLNDSEKRASYDRFGGDPDSMQHGGGFNPFAGGGASFPFGANMGGGGARYRRNHGAGHNSDEISPEDLFNMFFGAMSGQAFPASAFFGNAFESHGGGADHPLRRARQRSPNFASGNAGSSGSAAHQRQSPVTFFLQLLPLIILFIVTLFSSSFFGSSSFQETKHTSADPNLGSLNSFVSFDVSGDFTVLRETRKKHVPYYATPKFAKHFTGADSSLYLAQELENYEAAIESAFIKRLQSRCSHENMIRVEKTKKAKSADERKKINEESLPSCELLHKYAGASS